MSSPRGGIDRLLEFSARQNLELATPSEVNLGDKPTRGHPSRVPLLGTCLSRRKARGPAGPELHPSVERTLEDLLLLLRAQL